MYLDGHAIVSTADDLKQTFDDFVTMSQKAKKIKTTENQKKFDKYDIYVKIYWIKIHPIRRIFIQYIVTYLFYVRLFLSSKI